jgi:RNA-directed DNA polymerase
VKAVERRLREELGKLQVEINEEKSRTIDLSKGERFSFLGFEYRRILASTGVGWPLLTPKAKKRLLGAAKNGAIIGSLGRSQ